MSFFRHLYYEFKPYAPPGARLLFRRLIAQSILRRCGDVWPINRAAAAKPKDWLGWPGNKQFALVLTHDVEGPSGLSHCRQLMQLEMDAGVRSSFNFIPEGSYHTPDSLRDELKSNGFEIGVHDLHHDGKLYRTKKRFEAAVPRINKHLLNWGAVGFRSGFMHHNLDWLHHLDIEYDMSTFDTDPFEPQPDGVHTIFPFWLPSPHRNGERGNKRAGYVELPYTLPQDSTLFNVLELNNIDLWKRKLDWIAEKGGMALLNVHPDYISFGGNPANGITKLPSSFYKEFLNFAQNKYASSYWPALPVEVARYIVPK